MFVAIAAVATLLALGVVMAPLWRGSRVVVCVAVAILSLATFALYRVAGTPEGLQQVARAAAPATLDEAIVELERALQRTPNEPEGWRLLGQSYAAQERHAEAQAAFARAVELMPDEPTLLVEAAQSRLYASATRRMDADAMALLQRALTIDPGHQRALWFMGIALRQAGKPAEAASTWETLLPRVDEATATSLRVQIGEARAEAGLEPLPMPPSATAGPAPLVVNVALDPDFAARVRLRGDAVVFVIARVPGGAPMPVAVERHTLQELPLRVSLDDTDSLMPTQRLSSLQEVELVARLSASGDATRQQDDLESPAVRVRMPATGPVDLVIGGRGQ